MVTSINLAIDYVSPWVVSILVVAIEKVDCPFNSQVVFELMQDAYVQDKSWKWLMVSGRFMQESNCKQAYTHMGTMKSR